MKVFVFWPVCSDLGMDIGQRMVSGKGMHCVACSDLEDAERIVTEELRHEKDFMIIEGSEIKRWVDKNLPWGN